MNHFFLVLCYTVPDELSSKLLPKSVFELDTFLLHENLILMK